MVYKAGLIFKGFNKKKKKRVDFYEIFSPIINMSSIIMVLG